MSGWPEGLAEDLALRLLQALRLDPEAELVMAKTESQVDVGDGGWIGGSGYMRIASVALGFSVHLACWYDADALLRSSLAGFAFVLQFCCVEPRHFSGRVKRRHRHNCWSGGFS